MGDWEAGLYETCLVSPVDMRSIYMQSISHKYLIEFYSTYFVSLFQIQHFLQCSLPRSTSWTTRAMSACLGSCHVPNQLLSVVSTGRAHADVGCSYIATMQVVSGINCSTTALGCFCDRFIRTSNVFDVLVLLRCLLSARWNALLLLEAGGIRARGVWMNELLFVSFPRLYDKIEITKLGN